jgi:anthranilate synthase/phosphoribosyltransferase
MILIIDNYDSFTYNLYQYISELGFPVTVARNDEITVAEIAKLGPSHLVVSPGPGRPEDAGISVNAIREFGGRLPILGVCLGHQAIGYAFGGKVVAAPTLMHGKTSEVLHDGRTIFSGVRNPLTATRYHSLVIEREGLPRELEVSAETEDGVIMAVRHRQHRIEGIQFHPESIMTDTGKQMLRNFFVGEAAVPAAGDAARGAAGAAGNFDFVKAMNEAMAGGELAEQVMYDAVTAIMSGGLSDVRIAGFLSALRTRRETAGEVAAAVRAMLDSSVRIRTSRFSVDTCGTGGDRSGTFNISTAAAFVAAGAGVTVAKHGNRSVTSSCGSSEVFLELGVNITARPHIMEKAINEVGIGFLLAPLYHPAMKYVANVRKELGVRTMFNILGPLSNPARAEGRVLGVFDESLLGIVPSILARTGVRRAFVLRGRDGLDEISLNAETRVVFLNEGEIREMVLDPGRLGFKGCDPAALRGGGAAENADIIRALLSGARSPARDITVLNAAAAIVIAGLADGFEAAIGLAESSIDSGKALEKLEMLKIVSNSV